MKGCSTGAVVTVDYHPPAGLACNTPNLGPSLDTTGNFGWHQDMTIQFTQDSGGTDRFNTRKCGQFSWVWVEPVWSSDKRDTINSGYLRAFYFLCLIYDVRCERCKDVWKYCFIWEVLLVCQAVLGFVQLNYLFLYQTFRMWVWDGSLIYDNF